MIKNRLAKKGYNTICRNGGSFVDTCIILCLQLLQFQEVVHGCTIVEKIKYPRQ